MNLTSEGMIKMLDWYAEQTGRKRPAIFIETGTMYGGTTREMVPLFKCVHTIERDPQMFDEARKTFARFGPVPFLHLGDSRHVLPVLLYGERIYERGDIVFYLDAHWCRELPRTDKTRLDFPLWDELAIIRNWSGVFPGCRSLVIVDDVHAWGGGADGPAPFWATVSHERICQSLLGVLAHRFFGDQLAIIVAPTVV